MFISLQTAAPAHPALMRTLAQLPVADWQFWVVTTIALSAVIFLARPLLRKARGRDKEKPATLTIGGKALSTKPPALPQPRSPENPPAPPSQSN